MAPGFQDVLYSFIQTVSYKRCSLAVIFYFLFQDACICLRNVLPTWSINRSCIIQSRLQRCGRFIVFNRQIYLSSGTTAMFFSGQKLSISECFFFLMSYLKKLFWFSTCSLYGFHFILKLQTYYAFKYGFARITNIFQTSLLILGEEKSPVLMLSGILSHQVELKWIFWLISYLLFHSSMLPSLCLLFHIII